MEWLELCAHECRQSGDRGRVSASVLVILAAVGLLLTDCLVDPDAPCDANQVERDDLITGCECAEGYVVNAEGSACVSCGPNSRVLGSECSCLQGFVRSDETGQCESTEGGVPDGQERPTGEGFDCSSEEDCAGFEADYCQRFISPYVCLVQHCATGANSCVAPYVCCDYGALEILAPAEGLCIPAANCVSPGTVVR